jgi:hypothetical protein
MQRAHLVGNRAVALGCSLPRPHVPVRALRSSPNCSRQFGCGSPLAAQPDRPVPFKLGGPFSG